MKRSEFLKRLGIGTAAAVVSPMILAQAMQESPEVKSLPDGKLTLKVREQIPLFKSCPKKMGTVMIDGKPVMEIHHFELQGTRDPVLYHGGTTYGQTSYEADLKGVLLSDRDGGSLFIDKIQSGSKADVEVLIHDTQTSFMGYVKTVEFQWPAEDAMSAEILLSVSGAVTIKPCNNEDNQ
jgi:hypothetical protein